MKRVKQCRQCVIWKEKGKRKLFVLLGILLWCMAFPVVASAQSSTGWEIPYEDEIDYDAIERTVEEIVGQDGFHFQEYVYEAVKSGEGFSIQHIMGRLVKAISGQITGDKGLIYRFLGITLLGAVFTTFAKVFRDSQVSEMGFYITYLLLFSLSCASFYTITEVAVSTVEHILEFMRSLIPAYYMAVMFTGGIGTSTIFYQVTLILIQVVELLILNGVIPLIRIYFVLSLANNLSKEDMLSKGLELLETVIKWVLKSLLGLITGYNVIQGLIVPVADSLKNRMAVRVVTALPGVGSVLGSAAETVLGAGIVLKNAIGAAGICVLILILCVPLIRILFHVLIYRFAAAVVQPISDKRIVEALSGCARASGLLLFAAFAAGILFLLTILVVMATTNGGAR